MWDLAVREDDYAAVESMLQRFSGAPLSYRIPPAYARGDTAAVSRLHGEARELDARQSQIAARYMATYRGNFAAAETLAKLDLQPRRNAAIRLGAQSFLGWLAVARGDWPAASKEFREAERLEGGRAILLERARAATLPFVRVPRASVAAIRSELEAWQPAPASATAPLQAALEPHLRLYLLGLLSARLDESAEALGHARAIDALPVPENGKPVAAALAATVRADVALRQRQPTQALEHLRLANGQVPLELVVVRPFVNVRPFSQEHARYLRAEALTALGRNDEARRWLSTSFQGSPLEMVYAPVLRQRLSR